MNNDFDLTSERAAYDWASKQAYIALANMLTAAAFIGIDSCPIEGFDQKSTEKVLAEDLMLDMQKYGLPFMFAFGYRSKEQPVKTRRSIDEIVTWK